MLQRVCLSAFTVVVLFALVGCENKLTRQNFNMLKEGMSTKLEAENTLGKPAADHGDAWEWEDEDRHVTVFVYWNPEGKVERKEWIDAKTGEWEGAAPGIKTEPEGRRASDQRSNATIKKD